MAGRPGGSGFWILNRLVNPVIRAILRSRAHRLLSGTLALITVSGRRSGRAITVPVMYELDGDRLDVRVGWAERKNWWRNLRGGRHPVRVVLRGEERSGSATLSDGDDVSVTIRLDPANPAQLTKATTIAK